jgi:DNA-binding GntR family transcriptional regulator
VSKAKTAAAGRGGASDLQLKLASKIRELAVAEDWPAGTHLREVALAEYLGVSRSPVRAALRLLDEQGLVRTGEQRGYVLAKPGRELAARALALPEAADDALYERLIEDRVRRRIADQVTEADLLRQYDVTRSKLLKILNRLAAEGIVERARGYGWRFLPTLDSERANLESYRYRMLIEPAGLREPTFKAHIGRLRQCRDEHTDLLSKVRDGRRLQSDLFELNASFHELLAEFSGNRFILQSVQQQNRLRRLLEYASLHDPGRIRQSCEEHIAILDSIEAGDADWAATLLERHLSQASQLALAFHDEPKQ